MIKPMLGGLLFFYRGLMLRWVIGLGFENTCIVSGKRNVSRVIPRLFLSSVQHSVIVMTVGSQTKRSQTEPYNNTIFDSHFIKFVFRISGGRRF